jgi:lipid II:glycine glycyltransferase (peptidoglycan interpeptide bridge formation enzyme)
VRWTVVTDADAASTWDRDLAGLPGQSLVQSVEWGRYKATQGWTPLRWAARADDGRLVAMVQTLVRKYPCRTVVVWCPGGLAGPVQLWAPELLDQISITTRARQLYCRVAFSREKTEADADWLRAEGWTPPRQTISAPRTMVWDLSSTEDELQAGWRPNWRRNLKRALNRNLRVVQWTHPSVATLARLFETMTSYKNIGAYFDAQSLTALFRALDGQILVYACEDESGAPLAVRGCAIQHGAAWDLLAATSPEGRRCYASYSVFWALVRHCRALDVTRYDVGGVEPASAPGVYDFKRGTGARELECLGEWEWTTSPMLRHFVNLAVRRRAGAGLSQSV